METLNILLYILVISITTPIVILNFVDLRKGFKQTFLFIYPVFYIFFILPILIKPIFGMPDYESFVDVYSSIEDPNSICIYLLFILLTSIFFFLFYAKSRRKSVAQSVVHEDTKPTNNIMKPKNNYIENGVFIGSFLAIVYFVINPQYWYLIGGYGFNYLYEEDQNFPVPILSFTMLACLIYIYISKKNVIKSFFIYFNLAFSVYIKGSRAMLFTSVVFVAFALILSGKVNPRKVTNILLICIPILLAFGFWYEGIYRPQDSSLYTYMSIDMSRDYTTIYAIHSELTHNMILDYRGQTFISDIFVWLPRSIFTSKPWPFAEYITVALTNSPHSAIGTMGWGTTTSIFSEFIANMGLIGLPTSVVLVQFAINKIDKVKQEPLKFIFIYVLFMLFTVQFQAFAVAIILFVCYYIFLSYLQKVHNKKVEDKTKIFID